MMATHIPATVETIKTERSCAQFLTIPPIIRAATICGYHTVACMCQMDGPNCTQSSLPTSAPCFAHTRMLPTQRPPLQPLWLLQVAIRHLQGKIRIQKLGGEQTSSHGSCTENRPMRRTATPTQTMIQLLARAVCLNCWGRRVRATPLHSGRRCLRQHSTRETLSLPLRVGSQLIIA